MIDVMGAAMMDCRQTVTIVVTGVVIVAAAAVFDALSVFAVRHRSLLIAVNLSDCDVLGCNKEEELEYDFFKYKLQLLSTVLFNK